jgi:hypothetical protein
MLFFKAACAEDAYCMITTFDSGMLVSLGAVMLMFFLTQASHHVMVRTWSFGTAYSYQEVWVLSFGDHGVWFPAFCLGLAYLVCMVTGLWEADSFVTDAVLSLWPDAPTEFINSWFLQYFFLVIFTIPLCFTTKISWFVPAAWIGFFATITAVSCLGIQAFRAQAGGAITPEIPLAVWDFALDFSSLSAFNVAFFAHSMVIESAREMENATRKRILSATYIANILCGICVYLIPAFGYLTFAEVEDGENVFHYLDPAAPEVIVGKFAVLVNMCCSDMVFQFFLAKTIAGFITRNAENSHVALTIAGLIAGMVAIWVNFFDELATTIFFGIGLNAFSILAFVLPPVYFFAQYGLQSPRWALIAAVVLIIGGGMMVISFAILVMDLIAA